MIPRFFKFSRHSPLARIETSLLPFFNLYAKMLPITPAPYIKILITFHLVKVVNISEE